MKKSQVIAISGISTALAVTFVMLACYIEPMTITFYVLSAIAMMLPICKDSYKGAFLSCVATIILTMSIATIKALPFAIFFGPYTIISILLSKKVKWYISLPIKLGWFNLVLYILYLVTGVLVIDFSQLGFTLEYWAIALIGSALFILYDLLMDYVFKALKYLVAKYIK